MINFDNLTPISGVNSRANYDLRYSSKTEKFQMSQSAYDRLNMSNNGFNAFRSEDDIVLQIVPNEEASIYSGKQGSTKGLVFTATSLVDIMQLKETTEFKMIQHTHQGRIYISLEPISNTIITEETEENTEDESFAYGRNQVSPDPANY